MEKASSFEGLGKKTEKMCAFGVTLAVLRPQGRPSVTAGATQRVGCGVCPRDPRRSRGTRCSAGTRGAIRCWVHCGHLMKMDNCMFGVQEAAFFFIACFILTRYFS